MVRGPDQAGLDRWSESNLSSRALPPRCRTVRQSGDGGGSGLRSSGTYLQGRGQCASEGLGVVLGYRATRTEQRTTTGCTRQPDSRLHRQGVGECSNPGSMGGRPKGVALCLGWDATRAGGNGDSGANQGSGSHGSGGGRSSSPGYGQARKSQRTTAGGQESRP